MFLPGKYMSVACATSNHDACDGTAIPAAADDAAFLASLGPDGLPPCDCVVCHPRENAK